MCGFWGLGKVGTCHSLEPLVFTESAAVGCMVRRFKCHGFLDSDEQGSYIIMQHAAVCCQWEQALAE